MGEYTTRPVTTNELKDLIEIIATGYTDDKGVPHKPNKQIATILTLQANLGCRIGDICAMTVENFVQEEGVWKLDMTEQKTGKSRYYIVPTPVKKFVDKWVKEKGITSGRIFSIGEYAVWKQLRPATRVLELDNVSSHSIRKYMCLKVYETSGKDIALTSAFMNHSSPSTTYKYLKRSSKQMDEVCSKAVSCLM